MDVKFSAITAKTQDSGEYDKLLWLITPEGVKKALARGVKRPSAKLKSAAQPFAFYEYTAVEKNGFLTVTGASQIEDLSKITRDTAALIAASIIVESALNSFTGDCKTQFLYMLYRLKDTIYAQSDPYLSAIRFVQHLIHSFGYGYDYQKHEGQPDTPLKLLSLLSFLNEKAPPPPSLDPDPDLTRYTLSKIINNFETKFECKLLSKKLILS